MGIQDTIQDLNDKINGFFSFIGSKLVDFKNLSLGEQISFCCIGAGLIMVIVSIFMFILM